MGARTKLQEILQSEFSPRVDSSLIAAFVNEAAPNGQTPPPDILADLRKTLSALAAQADEDDVFSGALADLNLGPNDAAASSDESRSSPDLSADTVTTSFATDLSAPQTFDSPLGFLQAAFPHVDGARLRRELTADGDVDDVDMEAVVDRVLASEYVRELEERGLSPVSPLDERPWQVAGRRSASAGESKPKAVAVRKSQVRTTITLGDVRQGQQARPARSVAAPRPAPDPWIALTSVSTHLASLLPPHPPATFQSAFHSPEHPTPAAALRATLAQLAGPLAQAPLPPAQREMLHNMFDILGPGSQSMEDAELALRATHGRADDALAVVELLRELDTDEPLAMGVYHSPAPTTLTATSKAWGMAAASLPAGVGPPLASSSAGFRSLAVRLGAVQAGRSADGWDTIPQKAPRKGPHPLAASIPAYNPANGVRLTRRGGGNSAGKGGKGDVGELEAATPARELEKARRRVEDLNARRGEALKQATRAWQRGTTKTRGGEVAAYYAEQARELQEKARAANLFEARTMVNDKRNLSGDRRTVDLHFTTIAEAVEIARNILEEEGCSRAVPMVFITGRGTHSINQVGVLGPAVRNALASEGWLVEEGAVSLTVRGRVSN